MNREAVLKAQISYEDNTKRITKMRFCIISNFAYTQMRGHLQNFALDYHD